MQLFSTLGVRVRPTYVETSYTEVRVNDRHKTRSPSIGASISHTEPWNQFFPKFRTPIVQRPSCNRANWTHSKWKTVKRRAPGFPPSCAIFLSRFASGFCRNMILFTMPFLVRPSRTRTFYATGPRLMDNLTPSPHRIPGPE